MTFGWVPRALGILLVLAYPTFVAWQLDKRFGSIVKLRRSRLIAALGLAALTHSVGAPYYVPLFESPDVPLRVVGGLFGLVFIAACFYVAERAAESLWRVEAGPPLRRRWELLATFSFLCPPFGAIAIQKQLRRLLKPAASRNGALASGPVG